MDGGTALQGYWTGAVTVNEQTGKTLPNREEGGEPPAGTVVVGPVTGVVEDSAALAPELATG